MILFPISSKSYPFVLFQETKKQTIRQEVLSQVEQRNYCSPSYKSLFMISKAEKKLVFY